MTGWSGRRHRYFAWLTFWIWAADFCLSLSVFTADIFIPGDRPAIHPIFASAQIFLNTAAMLAGFATAVSGAGLLKYVSDSPPVLRRLGWHVVFVMAALTGKGLQLAFSDDDLALTVASNPIVSFGALALLVAAMYLGRRCSRSAASIDVSGFENQKLS